jgi:carboxymethylenebutenolidase
MKDRTETVKTADGAMEVYIASPDGPGPFPVVIQIMDALGKREELREHVRRVASWGYYVLAPDLFYRVGLEGPVDPSKPEGLAKLMPAMQSLTDERALSDIEATLKVADADKAARKGKIGLYGFCMGGKLALVLSQALGDRVAASASLHPGGLVTPKPESPHNHVDKVKAELYFGIADKDQGASPEMIAELEKSLKAKGVNYQLEWYPGAMHGWTMAHRADIYNKEAHEKSFGRVQALFAKTLR